MEILLLIVMLGIGGAWLFLRCAVGLLKVLFGCLKQLLAVLSHYLKHCDIFEDANKEAA